MAIPKIIHYCWFGRNPKPELAVKCIESWKKYCPDWQIIEWNEDSFDINSVRFVREAYENKKWAFVSDYARLYALASMGGVYMDTDVELIRGIDSFLEHNAFTGFEDKTHIPTGIMACEKDFPLIKLWMEYYSERPFVLEDGSLSMETNTRIITRTMSERGFEFNNKLQIVDGMAFYPSDYFCPKDNVTDKIKITKNTYAIHHFQRSWCNETRKSRFFRKHPKLSYIYHIPHRIFRMIFGKKRKK